MNRHPSTALTEEVSLKNGPKGAKAKQIFLGIDAHLKSYEVAIKRDNGAIQAAQRFGLAELLLFLQKQSQYAQEVYAVYEAGPLGYVLYRQHPCHLPSAPVPSALPPTIFRIPNQLGASYPRTLSTKQCASSYSSP
jgi:hypothetical protein